MNTRATPAPFTEAGLQYLFVVQPVLARKFEGVWKGVAGELWL